MHFNYIFHGTSKQDQCIKLRLPKDNEYTAQLQQQQRQKQWFIIKYRLPHLLTYRLTVSLGQQQGYL